MCQFLTKKRRGGGDDLPKFVCPCLDSISKVLAELALCLVPTGGIHKFRSK